MNQTTDTSRTARGRESREWKKEKAEKTKGQEEGMDTETGSVGKTTEKKTRRSGFAIMMRLIGLVRPLLPVMLAAIILGTVGYLCAISLTILAVQVLLHGISANAVFFPVVFSAGWQGTTPVRTILIVMVVVAVARGFLHYAEQYCNHFIAFKLLAIIRHRVFAALRRLCPAKLEGKDRGNLISLITTDIELLEVFYAHTISPIAIAILTSLVMIIFMGSYHVAAGILALIAYLLVGAVIPLINGRRGAGPGMEFRTEFGDLNSFILDSLRGIDETIQYGQGEQRKAQMSERSVKLAGKQHTLSRLAGSQSSFTNLVILLAGFAMLGLTVFLYGRGQIGIDGVLTCTVAMMGSFGPVAALSRLSNNLNQTLASGERVLSLLEEEPMVEEVPEPLTTETNQEADSVGSLAEEKQPGMTEKEGVFSGAEARHVFFGYEDMSILKDFSLKLAPGKITGIYGPSGCGKSTLLKLLMRFWDVDQGTIEVDGRNVKEIPTATLRNMESYVTQETHLFHDSIAANIEIGRPGASMEDIMEAAKKAAIHEFIMTLPQQYQTKVGELGDTLSGGQRQRIGIARAFLHDAPLLLLDEPTSNLDALNEGIILKTLEETCKNKTVVLVSHRDSTMKAADVVFDMNAGRKS